MGLIFFVLFFLFAHTYWLYKFMRALWKTDSGGYRHEGETLARRLGWWRVRCPGLDTWTQDMRRRKMSCRLLPDTRWTLLPAPRSPAILASGQRHGASLCQ